MPRIAFSPDPISFSDDASERVMGPLRQNMMTLAQTFATDVPRLQMEEQERYGQAQARVHGMNMQDEHLKLAQSADTRAAAQQRINEESGLRNEFWSREVPGMGLDPRGQYFNARAGRMEANLGHGGVGGTGATRPETQAQMETEYQHAVENYDRDHPLAVDPETRRPIVDPNREANRKTSIGQQFLQTGAQLSPDMIDFLRHKGHDIGGGDTSAMRSDGQSPAMQMPREDMTDLADLAEIYVAGRHSGNMRPYLDALHAYHGKHGNSVPAAGTSEPAAPTIPGTEPALEMPAEDPASPQSVGPGLGAGIAAEPTDPTPQHVTAAVATAKSMLDAHDAEIQAGRNVPQNLEAKTRILAGFAKAPVEVQNALGMNTMGRASPSAAPGLLYDPRREAPAPPALNTNPSALPWEIPRDEAQLRRKVATQKGDIAAMRPALPSPYPW